MRRRGAMRAAGGLRGRAGRRAGGRAAPRAAAGPAAPRGGRLAGCTSARAGCSAGSALPGGGKKVLKELVGAPSIPPRGDAALGGGAGTRPHPVLTGGEGFGVGQRRCRRVHLSLGARLANHVVGDQVAVEDVPRGGDEAAAVAHACEGCRGMEGTWGPRPRRRHPPVPPSPGPAGLGWPRLTVEGVGVHLEVPLAVGFGGEGGQADQADKRPLPCGTDGRTAQHRGTGTAGTPPVPQPTRGNPAPNLRFASEHQLQGAAPNWGGTLL